MVGDRPLLRTKPRGVPPVDDRRVLNGIFWMSRSGASWRGLPEGYGPYSTCYSRVIRWRKAGVWVRIIEAVSNAYDGDVPMIDRAVVRGQSDLPYDLAWRLRESLACVELQKSREACPRTKVTAPGTYSKGAGRRIMATRPHFSAAATASINAETARCSR